MQIFPRSRFFNLVRLSLALPLAVSLAARDATSPLVKSRTALVIGNARYESSAGRLRNTDNDAKAVASALRGLGFSVTEKHNVTREQLLRLVDDFRKTLPAAEIAVFYYAGHGIAVDGANYLVPLKSGFNAEGVEQTTLRMLAETRLFNAEQAVADMSAGGARCNIVILDACRNTPLARSGQSRSLTGHAGLVEMTPPTGSLIAFSTDAGRTAFDGDGVNGLYTEELLRYLRQPGLTIEQVFKRTRAAVIARSEGGQVPAEYSRLIGDDIYLAGKPIADASPSRESPVQIPADKPSAPSSIRPDPAALTKLAKAGQAAECLQGLEILARSHTSSDQIVLPLEALLERVKDDLKDAAGPSTRVLAASDTCAGVLRLLPACLPNDDPLAAPLAAKAHNRRGDALLLLGKPDEAIKEYDQALPLAPNDAYILYNRGRAYLASGKIDEARTDFTTAASDRFDQPKAKKLALQELAGIH
ncbi:MAG: caspase family protein [Chthoniobacterales bacterium]|nr:caspase family protein [Chthoniobacterales bacterium]